MSKKTIYLIRHAKSSWKDDSLPDRQRPLNKRGHRNAVEMASRLAAKKIRPDLMISSPAKRALTTAQYFASELDYPSFDLQIEERLYFCGVKGMLGVLKSLEDDIDSVMIFGHNPDISDLAHHLTGANVEAFPTCTVAKLKINLTNWSELKEGLAELKLIDSPKKSVGKNTAEAI